MKPDIQLLATSGDVLKVELFEGKALDPKEPKIIHISGTLDAPLRWLEKRITEINELSAHLLVDREALSLTLVLDEENHYRQTITGKLSYHPQFLRFGINTEKYLTNFEMADLIKMNRSAFENHDTAMALVSTLRNFRAKIEREMERSDDKRGTTAEVLRATVVENNLPETFALRIPIFKGTAPRPLAVEVYVRAQDFACTLISPEANDIREELRNSEIDRVLAQIREKAPDLAIIEQ